MEILIGILGLIVAFLTWRLSHLQNKMNEKEMKQKDFDRNFAAYQKLEKYIHKIVSGRLKLNDTKLFDEEIKDFQFVFSKEVNDFTQKVKSFGINLALLNEKISMLSDTELTQNEFIERKRYMSEKSELIKVSFLELSADLIDIFNPLLTINK
ncbi:MAG: hypothetical protein KGZ85_01030 [Ignavibacterium sp.]|nr:hypothetical protein [Ignavibacterium sp.]